MMTWMIAGSPMGLRPTLLCVQRIVPHSALAAESSAADWMANVCAPGVYATLTTTRQRTMVYKLSEKCTKLATALSYFARSEGIGAPDLTGPTLAQSLRLALANDSSVRFLPGVDELHITMHVSPYDEASQIYVQSGPPPRDGPLDAILSPPVEQAATSVRSDLHRGASSTAWATPLVHPSLQAAEGTGAPDGGFEETLLHEATTDCVLEGLTPNLFVVRASDGSLRTAGVGEGAYPGSVREMVLHLARESSSEQSHLFPGGVHEEAPTAKQLAAGEWREAWLTCSSRKVAPLARVWWPDGVGWVELPERACGERMRAMLSEEMERTSEPIM